MKKLILTLIIVSLIVSVKLPNTYPPVIVMELFTSQGCSSCPPADDLLAKIEHENRKNIVALSYHVDYWNYIGWKDPFSKSSYSDRQRRYASKFISRSIYTPQLVVNGKTHFVGSKQSEMTKAINTFGKIKALNSIEIKEFNSSDNKISYTFQIKGEIKNKVLRTAVVINQRITKIKAGENRNRTLKNSNIVVSEVLEKLSTETDIAEIAIPELVNSKDKLKLVLIVQDENLDIHGATQIDL
ncbi:MAG: DUF1223 domain-containing protein [Bacteroidota bacterium]